jgi:hypothetical protein
MVKNQPFAPFFGCCKLQTLINLFKAVFAPCLRDIAKNAYLTKMFFNV